jgi:hypothetical protein
MRLVDGFIRQILPGKNVLGDELPQPGPQGFLEVAIAKLVRKLSGNQDVKTDHMKLIFNRNVTS